jgi:23S rRNA pseudouridine1911/1915/1917 synthase
MPALTHNENGLDDEAEALAPADLHAPVDPAVPPRFIVPAASEGERLDKVLAQLLPEVSRSRIKQWIEDGAVRLNARVPSVRTQVASGDTIELAPAPSPQATAFHPEPIALDIVHADASILVLNKPAGLVVHPAAGNWSGTLLNGLLAYDAELARLPRAGIVHRLDADTSGLLVVARTAAAQVDLVRQLQARTVTREYWAVVFGNATAEGTVDAPIARDPRQPVRFKVSSAARAKPALTRYRRIETREYNRRAFSWLTCRLETGRTHQIRVHLESIGLPLVGDPVYRRGRPSAASTSTVAWARFQRQALHAFRLGLVHPRSGKPMQWSCEPPADMRELMLALGFDARRKIGAW